MGNKMLDPTKQTSFTAVRIDIDMMEIGPRVIETALYGIYSPVSSSNSLLSGSFARSIS